MHRQINVNWQKICLVVLVAAFILRAWIIFWQFGYYNFLVPPSPDLVAHLGKIDQFLAGKWVLGGYPPLFHLLIAGLTKVFSAEAIDVLRAIAPYWILAAIPPFYYLVRRLFNWQIAFWATLIYILVSTNPLLNFADAQYPDVLAYNIIAPFYLVFLVEAVKNRRIRPLIGAFGLFLLLLATHHLTSVLIFILTLITLLTYTLINWFQKDLIEFKKARRVTFYFLIASIAFVLVALLFFRHILTDAVSSILHFKPLIKDVTGQRLEYADFSTLLSPFLEFIGFAGLFFCLILFVRDKEKSFAYLLIAVWIILFWAMSLNSLFILPQRILRGVSLPLAIAGGIFAVEMLEMLKNRWQKIFFCAAFGYLILINTTQLYVNPFLLPEGLKYMVWFNAADQEKMDYITSHVDPALRILSDQSNPVLFYKLKKAGYTTNYIKVPEKTLSKQEEQEYLAGRVKKTKADFILINVAPPYADPETYFSQFGGYYQEKALLEKYKYSDEQLAVRFSDGSKLIFIEK